MNNNISIVCYSFHFLKQLPMQHQQTQNHFSFTLNNPTTTKGSPPNMVALKRIENFSYALTDEIGLGFTSHVYRGKNETNNELVAVKVIDLKNNEDDLHNHFINEEVAVLEKIKAAKPINLLTLECVIKTKNNLYIITEFCEGKDVGKVLRKKRRLLEADAQSIMKQLLNGYKQLYQLGLVHRDLKLANIFITKGKVKMADFGFTISEEKCHEKMEYNVGSPYYMPPEALKYNRYSYKSDVWGMGVIAFQLVYGRVPWRDKNDEVLFQMITTTPVDTLFDPDVRLSQEYKQFIIDCLTIDINKRATPEHIIAHEWPMGKDFVEGIEDNPRHTSIGHPANFRALNKTQIHLQHQSSKEKEKTFYFHRNQSPSLHKNTRERKNSNAFNIKSSQPAASQSILSDRILQDEDDNSSASHIHAENAILGQVHYCRFLFGLYRKIKNLNMFSLPQIKKEILSRISSKMKLLGEMVNTQKNLLKTPGFLGYIRNPNWGNLKNVVCRYDLKFRDQFQGEEIKNLSKFSDDTLKQTIRGMAGKLPENWRNLELLTFYYQLKELDSRYPPHLFFEHSKIEFLVEDSSRPIQEFQNSVIHSERLRKKLDHMLLV